MFYFYEIFFVNNLPRKTNKINLIQKLSNFFFFLKKIKLNQN